MAATNTDEHQPLLTGDDHRLASVEEGERVEKCVQKRRRGPSKTMLLYGGGVLFIAFYLLFICRFFTLTLLPRNLASLYHFSIVCLLVTIVGLSFWHCWFNPLPSSSSSSSCSSSSSGLPVVQEVHVLKEVSATVELTVDLCGQEEEERKEDNRETQEEKEEESDYVMVEVDEDYMTTVMQSKKRT